MRVCPKSNTTCRLPVCEEGCNIDKPKGSTTPTRPTPSPAWGTCAWCSKPSSTTDSRCSAPDGDGHLFISNQYPHLSREIHRKLPHPRRIVSAESEEAIRSAAKIMLKGALADSQNKLRGRFTLDGPNSANNTAIKRALDIIDGFIDALDHMPGAKEDIPPCHEASPDHGAWLKRVEELEAEGLDRSDAQGCADVEFENKSSD